MRSGPPPRCTGLAASRGARWAALALGRSLGLALLVATRLVAAQPADLREVAAGLVIDPEQISLSGVSSGAYMAQQFHVAHSSRIRGVGLIAGGPYRCAAGTYLPYSWMDVTGLYTATSVCSNTNPYWFYQGPPDSEFSVNATRDEAERGTIDHPHGMREDRVWLLSGEADDTVPRSVVDALERYYHTFVDAGAIRHVKLDGAGHAMITDDFGNECDVSEPPFISDCDFDAAGDLLTHIYGTLEPPAARAPEDHLLEFDQRPFLDPDAALISMHALAHLYVPASCRAGDTCRLHVAFHGCRQQQERIGDDFYADSGYNEWAETNRIVVLYPQASATSGGLFPGSGPNPRGCWDWWGYSGRDYHRKDGPQMRAVADMIDVLLRRKLLGE